MGNQNREPFNIPFFKPSAVTVGLATGVGLIYFPIPALVLFSGFVIFAKIRWREPVPWWVLAAMIGGLAAIAWVLQAD